MLEQYPDKVKIVFKNFPLPNHKYAKKAAIAALAAHRQGKFWGMHDRIFANYSKVNDEMINQFAKELDLDTKQFDRDRLDKKLTDIINRDLWEGKRAGVRGTPTVYINGKPLKKRSLAGFRRVIDQELRIPKNP